MKLQKGFTLIEILVVVTIFAGLVAISLGAFDQFSKNISVANDMQEFYAIVKLAQSKTLASDSQSQYGVYVNTSASPHAYTLFKGATYATRDVAADLVYPLSSRTEFAGVAFGSGNEMVFDRITGYTSQPGSASIRLKADTSNVKTLYVSGTGIVSFAAPATISDTRVKDSRHVHVDYSRTINTSTEEITLTFDGSVSQTIPIVANMSAGQISWTGTVTVDGQAQTVSVATHRLNSPDTQFTIHRDGRLNTKSLRMTLSGDSTGNIIQYSADGQTVTSSCAYASNLAWQ